MCLLGSDARNRFRLIAAFRGVTLRPEPLAWSIYAQHETHYLVEFREAVRTIFKLALIVVLIMLSRLSLCMTCC